jgi:flagellar biosynthetic protein FliQ
MAEGQILDLLRDMLWTTTLVAAPVLVIALVVGVAIGLVQALTSVQEMTLTFVPKLAAIAVTFWVSMGLTGTLVIDFFQNRILTLVAGG